VTKGDSRRLSAGERRSTAELNVNELSVLDREPGAVAANGPLMARRPVTRAPAKSFMNPRASIADQFSAQP
jgi:hypothetical protein